MYVFVASKAVMLMGPEDGSGQGVRAAGGQAGQVGIKAWILFPRGPAGAHCRATKWAQIVVQLEPFIHLSL